MDHVTIAEAAQRLGVSVDTVKRKLRRGELHGYKQPGGRGGFSWLIELGDSSQGNALDIADASMDYASANYGEVKALREQVAMLQTQVGAQQKQIEQQLTSHQEESSAKNRQIEQLHVLLQQAQAALPAPRDNRPWWQRLWQRNGR
jgi:excisionase family DNA binding protein